MKPFQQRNLVIIGAISLAVLLAMLLAAFNASKLPLIGGGDKYTAYFAEAGGLKANDEIRVAGVRVGKVESLEVNTDKGLVEAHLVVQEPVELGDETRAEIKVKTILGSMFVMLVPKGTTEMAEGADIPLERTESPYSVVDAFSELSTTVEKLDTKQLGKALTTLANVTRNTPDELKGALRGVSSLSRNLAARDEQINTLLNNLNKVAGVLDARDQDLVALMSDADVLFDALVQRRESISRLLDATSQLSTELTALVRDTRKDLKPALDELEGVVDILLKNRDNLDNALRLAAPFYRVFNNTLGTGPWFDTYIHNIVPIDGVLNPQSGGGSQ